jgi:hypothetical protein
MCGIVELASSLISPWSSASFLPQEHETTEIAPEPTAADVSMSNTEASNPASPTAMMEQTPVRIALGECVSTGPNADDSMGDDSKDAPLSGSKRCKSMEEVDEIADVIPSPKKGKLDEIIAVKADEAAGATDVAEIKADAEAATADMSTTGVDEEAVEKESVLKAGDAEAIKTAESVVPVDNAEKEDADPIEVSPLIASEAVPEAAAEAVLANE